jgi:hypothetical protein
MAGLIRSWSIATFDFVRGEQHAKPVTLTAISTVVDEILA